MPDDHEGEVVATLVHRPAVKPPAEPARRSARRCCTCTASPTTSSRPGTPSGGPSAATTSTPSTCASTAARSGRTRHRTTSATSRSTSTRSRRPGHRIVGRDGHDHVIISAHSTGGLIVGLWANAFQPEQLAGMVLNSPWTDLAGSTALRLASTPVLNQVGVRQPMREIKRQVTGLYGREPAPRARRRVGLRPAAQAGPVLHRSTPAGSAPSATATPSCTAASTSGCRSSCCPPVGPRPRRR